MEKSLAPAPTGEKIDGAMTLLLTRARKWGSA